MATLIIVMSVMNGFRTELLTRIIGMRGHVMVYGIQAPINDYQNMVDLVQKIPGVEIAYPMIDRQAIISFRSQARGVSVYGITQSDLQHRTLISSNIKVGSIDNFEGDSVFIGRRMADSMHINAGDRLVMLIPEGNATAFGTLPKQKSFHVKGIFEIGMHEFDKNIVFMPMPIAQTLFKLPGQVSHLEVFSTHPELAGHLAHTIQQTVGNGVRVLDWQHGDSHIFQAVQVERNVMFLILTLIILIASFNIISSLIMLVKDKTRDIAILRTMGASRRSMMRIFFLTGAAIGFIGTMVGVILGLGFAFNIESIRQFLQGLTGTELFNAEIYFLSQLPVKIDWHEVMTVISMALSLSFLATIYPAWRAARLDPVEALRF